jgi:urease accessory protein
VEYLPEPMIVTERAWHRAEFVATLAGHARLRAREVLVLGRDAEPAGRLTTSTVVRRDGRPVLSQQLDIGGGALGVDASPALLAGRRVLATELRVGYGDPSAPVAMEWASLVPLAAGGSLATALAPDAVTAQAHLIDLADSAWV